MYEDLSSLYLVELIKEENWVKYPIVKYYIKNTDKIINNKLVSIPKSCYVSKLILSEKEGYNETDLCIKMKKNCIIKPNYNFSEIDSNKVLIDNNKISLAEGSTYLIEIKTDINSIINKIAQITKVQNRFIESYKNIKINNEKIYVEDNYKKILVCNHNKSQAENTILNTPIIKNENVLYMSFQGGMTALLRINKNMRNLNEHIIGLNEHINEQDKKINDLNNKIEGNIKEIKDKIKTINNQNDKLLEIKIDLTLTISKIEEFCNLALDSLRKFSERFIKIILLENQKKPEKLENNISESFLKAYQCFEKVCKLMVSGKEDILPNKIFQFIDGEKDVDKSLSEWENIKANVKVQLEKKIFGQNIIKDC